MHGISPIKDSHHHMRLRHQQYTRKHNLYIYSRSNVQRLLKHLLISTAQNSVPLTSRLNWRSMRVGGSRHKKLQHAWEAMATYDPARLYPTGQSDTNVVSRYMHMGTHIQWRRYQQLQLTVPCIYSRLMACQPVLQRTTEFIRCSLQVQHEHPDYHVGHRET